MGRITKEFHDKIIYSRRMERLKELLLPMMKGSKVVLDLGCGDGKIDRYIMDEREDIEIIGIDVLVRPKTYIEVMEYDGKTIPFDDGTYDTVMAVDVLHHTDNPGDLLKEMSRVSSRYIILKDHIRGGIISYLKLRAMDYVGNSHYKVRLPYNYLTSEQWEHLYEDCGLKKIEYQNDLNLYTGIFHYLFDRKLHFVAVLEKSKI